MDLIVGTIKAFFALAAFVIIYAMIGMKIVDTRDADWHEAVVPPPPRVPDASMWLCRRPRSGQAYVSWSTLRPAPGCRSPTGSRHIFWFVPSFYE